MKDEKLRKSLRRFDSFDPTEFLARRDDIRQIVYRFVAGIEALEAECERLTPPSQWNTDELDVRWQALVKESDKAIVLLTTAVQDRADERDEARKERDEAREALEWCSDEMWNWGVDEWNLRLHFQTAGMMVRVPASDRFKKEWDIDTMPQWKWLAEEKG